MKRSVFLFALCFFAIASLPRFFSLDAHWSSDESLWLSRSATFISAVKQGQFSETLVAYHPGVTTMWLAGIRKVFVEDTVSVSLKDLVLARWGIGLIVLGGLIVVFFLLHRLFPFWPAMFAWGFIAINPFFLAQTRRVHTDALAAIFMLLTVLLFLLYCQAPQQHRYLIASGIAFGLACLSKSYALILLLWVPTCIFLFHQCGHPWRKFFSHTLLSVLLFLNYSLVTVFIVWPVFWNSVGMVFGMCLIGVTVCLPRALLGGRHVPFFLGITTFVCVVCAGYVIKVGFLVFDKVNWAVTTAHEVEHFFLGKIISDPGWFFYLFVLSIKSTPFSIPLAICGIIWLWNQRKEAPLLNQQLRIAFSLLCGILLFTLCLFLTAKKLSRYLLPVFPILVVCHI